MELKRKNTKQNTKTKTKTKRKKGNNKTSEQKLFRPSPSETLKTAALIKNYERNFNFSHTLHLDLL